MDIFPVALAAQPIVVQDVAPAETFGSVAAALKALSLTAETVFSRIENRVADERARLAVLNDRIGKAKTRIGQMTGSSKAITIFSQPKYPAAEVARLSTYMCLSESATTNKLPDLSEPLDQALAPLDAAPNAKELLTPDDEVLTRPEKQAAVLDLLARVSLKGNPKKVQMFVEGDGGWEGRAPVPEAGLGVLPSHMPAVSSVLLFNSKENPYKRYKTINQLITEEDEEAAAAMLRRQTLGAKTAKQRQQAEEQARKLGIAPSSLYEGDNLPAVAALEYTYKPRMKELVAFELPSNLALPAIADISLQADIVSIAPSVIKAGNELQLPNILDLMTLPPIPGNTTTTVVTTTTTAAPAAAAAPVPVAAVAPPPVAVPPPVAPAAVAAPVPPPVPQAAPVAAAAAPAAPAIIPAPPEADSSVVESRGGLLAALANPDNIRKLKKASNKPPAEKKKPAGDGGGDGESGDSGDGDSGSSSKAPPAGPMSMMDEMRLKMQMKRRAIAGNAAKESGGGGSGSSAAPPPPKPSSSESSSSSSSKESGGAGAAPKPPSSRPPLPTLPSAMPAAEASKASPAASSSSSAAGGLFNPDAMPGFRAMAAVAKKNSAKKKRKDSDDWSSTDEDSD